MTLNYVGLILNKTTIMKTLFSIATLLAAYSIGTPTASFAQVTDTTTASAPTQAATTVAPNAGLTVSGYIEAYYNHDFTAPKTTQEKPGFLYNHKRNREVNINLAFIKASYTSERVRGNLALQVGNYAQYNYAAEQELMKNVFEANAGVKLSKTRDLWLDAGVFSSFVGFESAISKDCWTLTRSILAENSPYYLSGAKITYNSANGKWTLLGSVLNGWQRIKRLDGYTQPSFGTQVQYKPSAKLTLNWSTFIGSDRPDSLKQSRFFNNFYAIWQPTDRLGITAGFDTGRDRQPVENGRRTGAGSFVWSSPVLIVRYKTTEKSYLVARIEQYTDRRGVIISTGTPNGFQTAGYSLGYNYAILPNALFRVETKTYSSEDAIFENRAGLLSRTNTSLIASLAISF